LRSGRRSGHPGEVLEAGTHQHRVRHGVGGPAHVQPRASPTHQRQISKSGPAGGLGRGDRSGEALFRQPEHLILSELWTTIHRRGAKPFAEQHQTVAGGRGRGRDRRATIRDLLIGPALELRQDLLGGESRRLQGHQETLGRGTRVQSEVGPLLVDRPPIELKSFGAVEVAAVELVGHLPRRDDVLAERALEVADCAADQERGAFGSA